MNILTWNINGIRATKVPLKKLFDRLDADIICLQETKVTRDQLDELSAIVEGYNSYFSFSKVRSGYSGVATFVKDSATPIKAEEGLAGILGSSDDTQVGCYGDHSGFITEELNALDREGRTMITQHRILTADGELMIMTVINVYCPHADPDNGERLAYKLNFYRLLQLRSEALLPHSHVVIVGDMNTSHKRIDHCDPDPAMEFERNPGRLWLSEFLAGDVGEIGRKPPSEDEVLLNGGGMLAKFIDTFRYFHPFQRDAYTCWRTTSGARATNYGTRIDYIFADRSLATTAFTDCVIRPDVDGSDHCPVTATLDIACVPSSRCPKLCTRHMPEFAGRQQKLLTFFPKTAPTGCATINRKCEGSGLDDGSSLPTSEEDHASSSSSQGASDPDASMIPSVLDARPVASNANRRCLSTGVKRKAATNRKNHGQVKQGNLLSFFHRPADRQPEACSDLSTAIPGFNVNVSNKQNTASSVNKVNSHSCLKIIMNDAAELSDNQQTVDKEVAQLRDCRSSTPTWKHLLSGPPVAPLCRGHKEACVLRTVKKDGPNKGRQFWVCARPEGHRTNRAASCEHFEWIAKKR